MGFALLGEGEGVPTASLQNYPLRLLNAEAGKLMNFLCVCARKENASVAPRKKGFLLASA